MSQTRRRLLVSVAAVIIDAVATLAIAEAPKHAIIGYLDASTANPTGNWSNGISNRLKELGWVEGRNLSIERRFADGDSERLVAIASELVRLKPHVIVVPGITEAVAAQRVTRSVPIVTLIVTDPVAAGFAKSVARPGGNVTGVLWADPGFAGKRLQLLKETIPRLTRVADLQTEDARLSVQIYRDSADAVAREIGVTIHRYYVSKPQQVTEALAMAKREKVDAVVSSYAGALVTREAEVREFAAANNLLDYYSFPTPVTKGGLISFAPRLSDSVRRGGSIVDRILRGANPAEIPFEYPTQYDLIINLKSAKERGIAIPQSVLLRATKVIE